MRQETAKLQNYVKNWELVAKHDDIDISELDIPFVGVIIDMCQIMEIPPSNVLPLVYLEPLGYGELA